jgi:hypothetical protein
MLHLPRRAARAHHAALWARRLPGLPACSRGAQRRRWSQGRTVPQLPSCTAPALARRQRAAEAAGRAPSAGAAPTGQYWQHRHWGRGQRLWWSSCSRPVGPCNPVAAQAVGDGTRHLQRFGRRLPGAGRRGRHHGVGGAAERSSGWRGGGAWDCGGVVVGAEEGAGVGGAGGHSTSSAAAAKPEARWRRRDCSSGGDGGRHCGAFACKNSIAAGRHS